MSELADFFFTAPPAAVRLQLVEISHPNFSTTYRLVRNAVGGIYVYHENEQFPTEYTYLPMRMEEIGSDNSMDQSLEITLGDLGELIPIEVELVNSANAMNIKPTLVYREYRSDEFDMDGVGGGDWIFDGVDDRINMIDRFDQDRTDSFAVFAWTNVNSSTGTIVAKKGSTTGVGWRLTAAAAFIMTSSTGGEIHVQAATIPTNGVDNHIGVNYDGSETAAGVEIWVNGVNVPVVVVTDTLSTGITTNAEPLQIGICGSSEPLDGQIRHVTLWDRGLTDSEVAALYNNGTPPNVATDMPSLTFEAACEGWFRLDYVDNIGLNGIIDHSPVAGNGTAGGGLEPSSKELAPVYQQPIFGPVTLEITDVTFNKEGATFSARPKLFNRTRTGEYYIVERFPMLRGFL